MDERRRIIDTDLHHHFSSPSALDQYMPEGVPFQYYSSGRSIPHPGAFRHDAARPEGGTPSSDPAQVVTDHIERYGIDYAVLMPGSLLGLCGLPDADLASAIASATNDWTINEWLSADERFLGAILVAPRDPERAADEIRRLAGHPRMVQATVNTLPCLLGDPALDPIFAACAEVGIPLTMHLGQNGGVSDMAWPIGGPTSFCESHTGITVQGQYHLLSLITEGVFVRYPTLRVVFNEFGIAWLPFVMWRLDMEYRAFRKELPWLTRLPSEYIRDHVRFTTQPLEEPARPMDLVTLLSLVEAEGMLMFSSDYPHWDADNPEYVLRAFPEETKQRILFDTAYEVLGLEGRLAAVRQHSGTVATAPSSA
jgi:uncharacterized protein